MDSNGQRLYSVITRAEVLDKMMKEIVQISEVFSLSQSDATLALIRLGWDSFKASDLLGDGKEKFLSKLGFVQAPDGDGDALLSAPLCSHKFCSDCWRDHLEKKNKVVMISCLDQVCVASVGPGTIEKLAEPVKEMYERYVLGSFMESNKIKWCPAKGCEYAIERHEDPSEEEEEEEDGDGDDHQESSDFGVVCLCGHTFCWSCKLESHRPVTCNNASLWLNQLLDEAKGLASLTTKPCPRCNCNMRRSSHLDWGIVTCVCSYAFCWRCLIPEEYHRGAIRCCEVYVPTPHDEAALTRHLALWEEAEKEVKTAKLDLVAIERNSVPELTESCGLGELDIRAVREACTLIVQCRLALKWCSVFGYFIHDYHSARKQYLNHLGEGAAANLLKHKGRVDELVGGAISGEVVAGFRHKIETSTTATGDYFHWFLKTVEEGLRDVKAGVYENVPTDYWFCDRCTFQNDAFERKCRICVFPFEGPSPPLASAHQQGGTNTAASGDQQGVPNMSSNPFAREGGTNVFESAPVVAFGNSNSAQVPNMSNNNPFASPLGFGNYNNNIGASVDHQQQVSNMANNNPFAYGTGASAHDQYNPNMANNNPFAGRVGPIFFELPVAYGNNNSGYQVPNMAAENPFARPGGTNPLQSPPPPPPFMVFGSASGGAHQQQAGAGAAAPNMPKEEPNLGNSMESE